MHALLRLLVFAPLAATLGCSFFLPPHANSHSKDEEQVAIRPLTLAAICARGYWKDYRAAFLPETPNLTCETFQTRRAAEYYIAAEEAFRPQFAGGAAAAGILLGFAVDLAEKELRKEAGRYEASFKVQAAFEGFYENSGQVKATAEGVVPCNAADLAADRKLLREQNDPLREQKDPLCHGSLRQHHYGFEIRRATKDSANAYRAIFGIHFSEGNRLLRVAPLAFQTQKARAKVLDNRGIAWLYGWALDTGDSLDTETIVAMEAIHVKADGTVKTVSLGPPVRLHVPKYDLAGDPPVELRLSGEGPTHLQQCPATIDEPEEKKEGDDAEPAAAEAEEDDAEEPVCFAGFVAAVPVSVDGNGEPTGNGAYYIKALVTERDPSNAKEALEGLASQVREQGDAAVKKLTEEDAAEATPEAPAAENPTEGSGT